MSECVSERVNEGESIFTHARMLSECERRRDMAEVVVTLPTAATTSLTIPTRQHRWDSAIWEFVFVIHPTCEDEENSPSDKEMSQSLRVSAFTIEASDAVECPTNPDNTELVVDPAPIAESAENTIVDIAIKDRLSTLVAALMVLIHCANFI